ncbi:hypothetical protein Leryth_026583, partial [Lithospermum erythrorhizon]
MRIYKPLKLLTLVVHVYLLDSFKLSMWISFNAEKY